ncbi:hypothetical protein J6590_023348, partial [Homalodisca vitripennis]
RDSNKEILCRRGVDCEDYCSSVQQGISIAHRLPAPRDRRFHPTIVIQFVSRSVRFEWLAAARKYCIQATELVPSLQPAPLFISEHLTAHNKAILERAKAFVKFRNLAYVWSREGRIMVRKKADSPAQRFSSFERERVRGGMNEGKRWWKGEGRHRKRAREREREHITSIGYTVNKRDKVRISPQ